MIVGVRYQCGHCPTSPSFNLVCLEKKKKGCILIEIFVNSVPIAKSGHTIITILHMSFSNFQDLWTDLWNHHRLYCRPCKRTFFYVIPTFVLNFFTLAINFQLVLRQMLSWSTTPEVISFFFVVVSWDFLLMLISYRIPFFTPAYSCSLWSMHDLHWRRLVPMLLLPAWLVRRLPRSGHPWWQARFLSFQISGTFFY